MTPEPLQPDFAVPRHVGLIMDGNGRWAKRTGQPRLRGHEAGVESVRDVVEAAAEWGIQHLTLYAFSVENWPRPPEEVEGLMAFLAHFLREEEPTLLRNGVRLKGLGDLSQLPAQVRATLAEVEQNTAGGDRLTLRLALSYGGRQEIAHAARKLAQEALDGKRSVDSIDLESLSASMYDPEMPDPDLIVRTASEIRLSNFLLWQASYAEFHFTDTLWPDFRREHLYRALQDYHGRVRRFGKVLSRDPAVEDPA
jgi:undecaprenyl diphosphate synthase